MNNVKFIDYFTPLFRLGFDALTDILLANGNQIYIKFIVIFNLEY